LNASDKRAQELMAYYDGELTWWRRWRFERRLRNSADLRQDLAELENLSTWVREIESDVHSGQEPSETPDLWSEIGPALSQIDREVASTSASSLGADFEVEIEANIEANETGERGGFASGWNWGSLAATGAVAMMLFAVLVDVDPLAIDAPTLASLDNGQTIAEHSTVGFESASDRGSLRYLQTNGVSYVVSQDSDDVTIIWLMDDMADAV
jgi:anti-sigma factor RsiW